MSVTVEGFSAALAARPFDGLFQIVSESQWRFNHISTQNLPVDGHASKLLSYCFQHVRSGCLQ